MTVETAYMLGISLSQSSLFVCPDKVIQRSFVARSTFAVD
jgi:hypothetical protein